MKRPSLSDYDGDSDDYLAEVMEDAIQEDVVDDDPYNEDDMDTWEIQHPRSIVLLVPGRRPLVLNPQDLK